MPVPDYIYLSSVDLDAGQLAYLTTSEAGGLAHVALVAPRPPVVAGATCGRVRRGWRCRYGEHGTEHRPSDAHGEKLANRHDSLLLGKSDTNPDDPGNPDSLLKVQDSLGEAHLADHRLRRQVADLLRAIAGWPNCHLGLPQPCRLRS